ncbi:multidrug resistance-like protein [Lindgomyces ingoldianus]|uniref:Multidrug resistance-like protein n=1 Tax=Lindgomyces ingoldianus TaxID=673940 RepID=A0ACB6RG19_9PLEO|nr:multidrug resistance-like protein [Lindgomyces ingoldianus]KAF2478209.1 multidrug resistance-like protein [Lindgomyces ingoldianus]
MNETTHLQCSPSVDEAFGPIVEGCRRDFTFTFEQYVFSILPSVLFLLFAPLRVQVLRKRESTVGGKPLRSLKLLTTLITWATTNLHGIRTLAAIATSLSFLSSLVLCMLSYLEHSRSLRPSALLNAYLLFSLLFDAVVLRTLWMVVLSSIATMLFLEAKEKRGYLKREDRPGPEETSGLYSQTFVWWMNWIIREGNRHVLKPTDLYPVDENMKSEVLNDRFWREWNTSSRTTKPSLTKVIVRLLKWPLVIPILPRLVLLGFTFCQPLMVSRLLQFLQDGNRKEPLSTGYGLIGAYAVVYFGMSVSNSLFLHRNYRCLTMLRGTLVAAIYTKTTEISITALDNSSAVTLMSTDVERLVRGLRNMHNLWANIIQFALATWLLSARLGWACVAPIIVTLITSALTIGLAFVANKLQLGWITKIQKRIGITSNMLGYMKGVKMSGLTARLSTLIQNLRINEIKYAEKFWSLGAISATLAFMPIMLSPVATFAFYAVIAAKDGTTLDAPRLFTSLALLILLTQPLFALYGDIIEFRTTFGCVERIEKFLISESLSDHRLKTLGIPPTAQPLKDHSLQIPRPPVLHNDIELTESNQLRSVGERIYTSNEAVRIESGAFGWTKDGPPILQEIDISIQHSDLTLLIGAIASGKSTLLKAILGETPSSKGFVYVSKSEAAYCEQTPWLINTSVKENIVGFSSFDQNLYDTVIYCCDLEQDIATFPRRHDTRIGSKGLSLSSGQKQRIAIARAVYARKDFVVFDDVFNCLDANTQRNVFDRLLGPSGLFRKWNTTVLIATNAVGLLPFSDRIIALSPEGKVAEQGTFQELKAIDGYVSKFCLEHANEQATATKEDSEMDSSSRPRTIFQSVPNNSIITTSDDKRRQLGDWKVYQYYFGTIGWGMTTVFLALACGWGFFSTFPTVWLKWYADANASEPNKHTGYYLGLYTALQIVGLIDMCLLTWFSFNIMAKRSGLRLHELTVNAVMSAPMSFFSKTDTGSITTRFSQDMQLLDANLPLAVMAVTGGFLSCVGQIGLIASAAYYVASCIPVLFVIYYFVQRYYLRTSRQMRFLDLEEKAPVYTQFIESLSGLATIRAFAWQKASIAHNHNLVDKSQKPFYLMFMIQTWLTLVLDLITTALAILVVGVAVRMRDTISVGFTGVSLTQIISFTANLKLAILFWTQMETSIGAVARVKQFVEETDVEYKDGEINVPPPDWPSKGKIEIQNLTVSYDTNEDRKALNEITLDIPAGQKVAIVGRTGSGKSTLVSSLFRMVETSSGCITIDGIDLSTMPREYIRTRLNVIGEDPYFLTGSIRLNLDPYASSTDIQLRTVLEKVQLWAVVESKGGLDAEFSDDTLSHGQKQLFCLARALLRPGKVVVLDEVTSSVDYETDKMMQRVMREEFECKTVIAIAHRVETVTDFDWVVVLREGRVVEEGSPEELLKRQGGVFRDMVQRKGKNKAGRKIEEEEYKF